MKCQNSFNNVIWGGQLDLLFYWVQFMDSVIINKYDLVECQLIVLKLAKLIVEDYDRRYTLEELQGLYDKLLEMDSTKKSPIIRQG